jgi:hypothetical protein
VPTTDGVLAAMLANSDPSARLIAADYLDERGRGVEALWQRLLVGGSGGFTYRHRESGWDISADAWEGFEAICCTRAVWDSQGVGSSPIYFFPQRVGREGWGWCRVRQGRWQNVTPPPSLEAAVLAVLRRRLAGLQAPRG